MSELIEPAPSDDVTRIALDALKAHQEEHSRYFDMWEKIDRLYRGEPEEKRPDEPGQTKANVATLELYRNTEALVSAQDMMDFSDDPHWTPESTEDTLSPATIEGESDYFAIASQQHERMNYRMKMEGISRTGHLFGTAIAATGVRVKTKWIGAGEYNDEVVSYAGPWVSEIAPWRFSFAPLKATEIDECLSVMVRGEMVESELRDFISSAAEMGATVKDFEELSASNSGGGDHDMFDTASRIKQGRLYMDNPSSAGTKSGIYEIVDYWGIHPTELDPDDPEQKKHDPRFYRILFVGNEWAVQMPMPFDHGELPFAKWVPRKQPGGESFYGLGAGQICLRHQVNMNRRRNMIYNSTGIGMFGMWRRRGCPAGARTKKVRFFPNKIFDDENGIMEPMVTNPTPVKYALQLDAVETEEMRAAIGAVSALQAIAEGGTATENRNVHSEATRLVKSYAISFGENMIKPTLLMQHSLNMQYLPDVIRIRLRGPEGSPIVKEIYKENLPSEVNIKLKLALDLESRKPMARNINQAMQQQASILKIMPQAAPLLFPGIWKLAQKELQLLGIPPNDVVPREVSEMIATMLQPPVPQPGTGQPGAPGPAPA